MESSFEKIYYAPPHPAAYAGADKLAKVTRKKWSRERVIEWLESQDAYNLHKLVRRKFPRRSYNVRNLDDVWEADLMDLRAIKTYNDGYSYVLIVIDVVSKYSWAEPIKNKSSKLVAEAFERILERSNGREPVCLQTDKGKEFIGREMQALLRERGVRYREVRSPDTKAAIAERFIRTIKERMWRYFTHKNTRRYVDVLQNIVESYNNSRHSAIKMTPASVTRYNVAKARQNLEAKYGNRGYCTRPKYKVGDLVRVSRAKSVFDKGYESGWTLEIFEITRVSQTRQPPVYFVKDLAGEEIDGFFYAEELSRVRKNLKTAVFEVDRVLKSRGQGRSKEFFVSWKGYPESFNSWIKANQLTEK